MSGKNVEKQWSFWVDRGGTFTDIVARRPDGGFTTGKLLSVNPDEYEDAALEGIRRLMGLNSLDELDPGQIESVKMGTTVATNALLERKGERVALFVNTGFRDALQIGYQNRPKLFALHIQRPEMLYEQVVELDCRVGADGSELQPLDQTAARTAMQAEYDKGIRAIAITLMHSWAYPDHEKALVNIARDIGFTQISASHEVSPLIKFVSRGDTAVVDAYLTPVLRLYVDRVAKALGDVRLMFMQSNGGLTDARLFHGRNAILSGPAGGVVGAVKTAEAAGADKVIGFDMGGTSTDVCHYAGDFERAFETEVAGIRLRAPMMQIHTVAAGGGSILHFDGARYRVGPESAGAHPGPACYRKGGPLTVTDCNVMLGKLNPNHFPAIFGPNHDEKMDRQAVIDGFRDMQRRITDATGNNRTLEDIAEGFLAIAIENMANAIKKISVERGYDVTKYALVSFGGAGGQHACLVADSLSMDKVLLHPWSGVLSAYGMGLADLRAMREETLEMGLTNGLDQARSRLDQLAADAEQELQAADLPAADCHRVDKLHLRYQGSDSALEVPMANMSGLKSAFEALHQERYGFVQPQKEIIIAAVLTEISGGGEDLSTAGLTLPARIDGTATAVDEIDFYSAGKTRTSKVYDRDDLLAGDCIDGPAIVREKTGTIVIEPGWQARLIETGDMVLERVIAREKVFAIGTKVDPVMLEIFNNRFMSIAEQMGATLENTASSVNIKERLDFSCAIFDPDGGLVANAPHMPVHLGSMGESIIAVARAKAGKMKAGDVFMLNSPYNGGTHLPDVTIVTPVFDAVGNDVIFYVASRGHHADIGGLTPGSMPPDSVTIHQEGVLIDPFLVVENGRLRDKETRALLADNDYPARNPDQNVADFEAQIAANEKGVIEINRLIAEFGLDVVLAYMGHVQDNAEEQVRRVLDRLENGVAEVVLDQGAKIAVAVTVNRENRSAIIDFTGTSLQQDSNFNAPTAVAKAAVLYVFRCLVDDDIPLNAGCLKPLDIRIPDGSMLAPREPAAVVAGNVETSQCVTDALFAAVGALAGAQGSMNNLTFGDAQYQYYETLCGGSGAGPGFVGTDAVHTHMTNSRLTDPEILETRYPVRLHQFAIRPNTGGKGQFDGGNGAIRDIGFLQDMTVSILSNRRVMAPAGLHGGGDAAVGRNRVMRRDGIIEDLKSCDRRELQAGDHIVIETPGGGGYGKA